MATTYTVTLGSTEYSVTTNTTIFSVVRGATGAVGMTWQGAWSGLTAYALRDAVSLDGSSYVCIQANTNQDPATETAYWSVIASKGDTGPAGGSLPIGTVVRASQTPGATWLACDGSAYTQAAYADLYATIGLMHDFASWTAVGINNSSGMSRCGYGNGYFVSVENGSCKWSSDLGANWTRVINAGTWRGVAYSPTLGTGQGMWICVGDSGIMDYSVDNGATWDAVATPSFSTTNIQGIFWDSTNTQFVAVGDGGKLATSPDGATFTQRTSGVATVLYSGCHCAALGLNVVVGQTGTVITSPDGTAWTARLPGVASVHIYDVAWAANIGVALAGAQYGKMTWSRNGVNWVPFYATYENQNNYRVGTDGTRFLTGNYQSAEMTLIGADIVPRRVAQYTKSPGGIAYGGGAWVIGGTDLAVHAALAAYSYNSATSFRLPSPSLDAGIFADSWIKGDG